MRTTTQAITLVIFSLASTSVGAESPPRPQRDVDQAVQANARLQRARPAIASTGQNKALLKKSTIWPLGEVPVCWEVSEGVYAKERAVVRAAIAETWDAELKGKLAFVGWEPCPSGDVTFEGIRIAIRDEGPYTDGLGTELADANPGMVLNFEFKNWSAQECSVDESLRIYCIRAVAVHEFGHALGLAHEQNRTDTPNACRRRELPSGDPGDTPIGKWDRDSVMNYCNRKWNNNGFLSKLDKEAIRMVYEKYAPVVVIAPASIVDGEEMTAEGKPAEAGRDGSAVTGNSTSTPGEKSSKETNPSGMKNAGDSR